MEEKQYKQHLVTKSILLHLIPGVPFIAGLFIFALPVFSRILGIAVELHVLVGLTLSILITIVPIQLGILLYEGKKLNGKLSLKGVIGYTEKSSIKVRWSPKFGQVVKSGFCSYNEYGIGGEHET